MADSWNCRGLVSLPGQGRLWRKLKYFWKTHETDVRLNFFTKTCFTNKYFSRDPHFVILAWVQSWNIFEILMKVCSPPEFFHRNMSHEQLPFMWSTLRDSGMGTKLKYFCNSWNCVVRLNFLIKTCLTNNYLSRDLLFVILAWVQSWNIYEKHMKLWSSPEFFHKNPSHQQLPFMWSTLRDSSMGTKLKYLWKTHESVKSILLAIATGNTFSIICFNVATMVTKMYLFRDCYSFCLYTCSEYIGSFVIWFTCALTKPTLEQCSHPNGKHLLDW